jgi:glycerate kinase
VRPGFEVVAEAVAFRERVRRADAVVTGEGRVDMQSAFGKTTAGVRRVAGEEGKPVVCIAGSVEDDAAAGFDAIFVLEEERGSEGKSMESAAAVLESRAREAGRWLLGRGLLR